MPIRFLILLLWGLLSLVVPATLPAASDEHVNIVIILADDLGYGDLSCYGHPRFQTPHLDRMAEEGVRFTQFYTTCGYCAPSRASLMTGRYPHRNELMTGNPVPAQDYGVRGLPAAVEGDRRGLPPEELTLGELLQEAGFATCCLGKWHLGHQPQFHPNRAGFAEYFGILYSNDMHPVELWRNGEVMEYPVVQATLTRRLTAEAIRFIEEHQSQPFFLYLPHPMPHKPLAASEEYYGATGQGLYADVVAELDRSVGQLLETLQRLDLDSRTLVCFTSDNGPWYGGSTGGLRGMKGSWWEGGLRVPLIMRFPGIIPPGQIRQEPAIMLDLFTTALAAANVAVPMDRVIDGVNLLPALKSLPAEGAGSSSDRALFSWQGQIRSVRVGDWKLHRSIPPEDDRPDDWVDPRRPNGVTLLAPYEQERPSAYPGVRTGDRFAGWGLFHLGDDPAEQHNLAEQHPARVQRLQELIERMQAQHGTRLGTGEFISP